MISIKNLKIGLFGNIFYNFFLKNLIPKALQKIFLKKNSRTKLALRTFCENQPQQFSIQIYKYLLKNKLKIRIYIYNLFIYLKMAL